MSPFRIGESCSLLWLVCGAPGPTSGPARSLLSLWQTRMQDIRENFIRTNYFNALIVYVWTITRFLLSFRRQRMCFIAARRCPCALCSNIWDGWCWSPRRRWCMLPAMRVSSRKCPDSIVLFVDTQKTRWPAPPLCVNSTRSLIPPL